MMKTICLFAAMMTTAALTTVSAAADDTAKLTLPGMFSSHMVLQREAKIPVWGQAAAGERVTVTLGEKTATTTADANGGWRVTLDPQKAGPVTFTVVAGEKGDGENGRRIEFTDVLMGDVWVCSGQSNMDFKVAGVFDAEKAIAAADHPNLRLCWSPWKQSFEPLDDVRAPQRWEVCTPKVVADFSAVAYFFGRDVLAATDVPIGLVWVSCGWTPSEAWTSREALASDPEIKRDVLDRWDRLVAEYPARQLAHERKLADWKAAKAAAAEAGEPFETPEPAGPFNPDFLHRATTMYNGGIAPLTKLPIRGVIWYQGETNSERAIQYRKLFPMLIHDWRKAWGQPEMPFLFVQIANLFPLQTEPDGGHRDRAELRESQAMALSLPKTGMAVTIDIGDADDEHPRNKQDVGARLALAARAISYGEEKLVYSGPVYESMTVEGDKIRLTFKHVGGGLTTKDGGPSTSLQGFIIAGEDRKFVWADATVAADGKTILVSSKEVAKPVAVRYGWNNNPVISLYNQEGLPASPFRTDDWPGVTTGKTELWIELMMRVQAEKEAEAEK